MVNYDLFGDVVITLDDVEMWLDAVPKLPRDSPRRNYYAKNWDVANKIKSFKLAGRFEEIINKHLSDLERYNSGLSSASELYAIRFK